MAQQLACHVVQFQQQFVYSIRTDPPLRCSAWAIQTAS